MTCQQNPKRRAGVRVLIPNHMPGWDVTFSAPKSVSIMALVHKDERLTAAHGAQEFASWLKANVVTTANGGAK